MRWNVPKRMPKEMPEGKFDKYQKIWEQQRIPENMPKNERLTFPCDILSSVSCCVFLHLFWRSIWQIFDGSCGILSGRPFFGQFWSEARNFKIFGGRTLEGFQGSNPEIFWTKTFAVTQMPFNRLVFRTTIFSRGECVSLIIFMSKRPLLCAKIRGRGNALVATPMGVLFALLVFLLCICPALVGSQIWSDVRQFFRFLK